MRLRRPFLRVLAMTEKETLHIRRDPRTLYMALAMPVVMLLLFGYGLGFDVKNIALLVADADHSQASRSLVRHLSAGQDFAVSVAVDDTDVDAALRRGQAQVALVIASGFERDLLAGRDGTVQFIVDGCDGNLARQILAKTEAIVQSANLERLSTPGAPALSVKILTLFNPTGDSARFMVPGLAAYLLAIVSVLLTALTVAGEWERGSMEQLFASPVGRLEIVLGKLLPYLALGMVQLLLVITLGNAVFDVPIQGSVATLFAAGFLFLAGMLGQGLLISVLARNQLVATQAGALSSLLPSMFLSGLLVPIENMPGIIQAISTVVPARYLVHALRSVMLKGGGLNQVVPDLAAMLAFAVGVLALATLKFKRRLA